MSWQEMVDVIAGVSLLAVVTRTFRYMPEKQEKQENVSLAA
jgi:hypothetical protein